MFVVATANNIRKLPGSLTRPGRFDHILELRSPEGQDAVDIVAFYLSKKSYVADMDPCAVDYQQQRCTSTILGEGS